MMCKRNVKSVLFRWRHQGGGANEKHIPHSFSFCTVSSPSSCLLSDTTTRVCAHATVPPQSQTTTVAASFHSYPSLARHHRSSSSVLWYVGRVCCLLCPQLGGQGCRSGGGLSRGASSCRGCLLGRSFVRSFVGSVTAIRIRIILLAGYGRNMEIQVMRCGGE